MIRNKICLYLLACLLFSCHKEKKVINIVLVADSTNVSLPDTGKVRKLKFFNEDIGFAITETDKIYKTFNSGESWQLVHHNSRKIQKIEFFNQSKAWLLAGNVLYRSIDGGANWTSLKGSVYTFDIRNNKGIIITDTYTPYYSYSYDRDVKGFYFSSDSGLSIEQAEQVNIGGDLHDVFLLNDSICIVIEDRMDYFCFWKVNFLTANKDFTSFGSPGKFESAHFIDTNNAYFVGENGMIVSNMDNDYYFEKTAFKDFTYYGIDVYEERVFIVGEYSIVVNIDIGIEDDLYNDWTEVFKTDGTNYMHTFYDVDVVSYNTFFVSSDHGLIFKMKYDF